MRIHRRGAATAPIGASEQANGNGTSPHPAAGEVNATTVHAVDARRTASYGIRRADGIWVTECAWCERVRSINGDWQRLAPDLRAELPTERTHGICPECADACIARADELPNPWAE